MRPERRSRSGVDGGPKPPPPQNQRTLAERYPHKTARRLFFDVPLEECLRRNEQRARKVPADAIRAMAERLQAPAECEGFIETRIIT